MLHTIIVENLWKKFKHGYIFKKIETRVDSGQILTISGRNGAGKTTILKIISGLIPPEKGNVQIFEENRLLTFPYIGKIGFLGPYLELYDKLTALENLEFISMQLGEKMTRFRFMEILSMIGLEGRENDLVESFSSGMKQRMKYALLYIKRFPIYMLDEPTSNFDAAGRNIFKQFLEDNRKSIIIIASNEDEETRLGDVTITIS